MIDLGWDSSDAGSCRRVQRPRLAPQRCLRLPLRVVAHERRTRLDLGSQAHTAHPSPPHIYTQLIPQDENFHIIYTNAHVNLDEWHMFPVGQTHFNDDAVRRTAEHVISTMRSECPMYNLISNNCQTYALQLLDAIKAGGGHRFPTTLAVWKQLLGPGKVEDLFNPDHLPEVEGEGDDSVTAAQKVMDAETTQLDSQEQHAKLVGDGGVPGGITAGGDSPAVPAPGDVPVVAPGAEGAAPAPPDAPPSTVPAGEHGVATPASEVTPAQGATPVQDATPAQEATPVQEAPPAQGGDSGEPEQKDGADAEGGEQKKKKGAFARLLQAVRK